MARLFVLASVLVVVVACGGTADPTPSSSTSSSSSGGARDGGGCSRAPLAVDRACVPGTATPNAAVTLTVDQTQGCLPCQPTVEPCQVNVAGNQITLSVDVTACPPPGGECPAICGLGRATCTLPPLAPGSYEVRLAGEPLNAQRPTRELVVAAGGDASCSLPSPAEPARTIEAASYPRGCKEDEDCMLITEGDICAPCACPNASIGSTQRSRHAADVRARSAECAPRDPVVCGPCATSKAVCSPSKMCTVVAGP